MYAICLVFLTLSFSRKNLPRYAIICALFLTLLMSTSSLPGTQHSSISPRKTFQLSPAGPPIVGIDCGLGTAQEAVNASGFPVAPSETGTFQNLSRCTWIGDVGQNVTGTFDGTTEPLVTDQDETLSAVAPPQGAKIGGGFTADIVYLQNATSTINGFDLAVTWNPSILRAVQFDQGGLGPWNTGAPFTAISTIDNTVGRAELGQVILGSPLGSNFTLFRIRFDVVGVGLTALTLTDITGGITNPTAVVHTLRSGSFDSESFFDPSHTLSWSASIAFSPNPLSPGSPNTFTATATCSGCTTPLTYEWQFNSSNVLPFMPEATGNPLTIDIPNSTFLGLRLTLRIYDASAAPHHNVTLVQNLPLTAGVKGPSSLAVNVLGTWNGFWLGGIPPYSGNWRFCPGTGSTANAVCAKPNPSISLTSGQLNSQTLDSVSPGGAYHFAGVYNASITITDAGSPALSVPDRTTLYFKVNVTGLPQAYTLTVISNSPSNATAAHLVTLSASVAYASSYPTAFRSAAFSYLFDFGDGKTGTASGGPTGSIAHNYTTANTYNIRVTAKETSGFAPTGIQESGSLSLAVASPVSGTITLSSNSPTAGQSLTFTGAFSGGTGPYTYAWDFGDGSTGSGVSPSHVYSASGNYTVKVTVTDAVGRTSVQTQVVTVGASSMPPGQPVDYLTYVIIAAVVIAIIAGVLMLLRRRKARTTSPSSPSQRAR
jgi:chitodextrinase